MPDIGLILLAADASMRLGRPKQLLDIGGRSLISHAAQTALGSKCRPVTVVLGASADQARHEIALLPVNIIFCHEYRRGIGAAIRDGIEAIETDSVLLMQMDQHLITADDLNRLAGGFERSDGIVASSCDNFTGMPAIFGREFFPELLALGDRAGIKPVLQKHASHVRCIETINAGFDINSVESCTPASFKV